MEEKTCSSCKVKVANDNAVEFNCPNCSKYILVRCSECRKKATKYTCPDCGFVGPN